MKGWRSLENGKIGLPSSYVKNCIGERKLQKRGMFAEIISCVDANHIDVRFDDGTIIKKRKYNDFVKGVIGNPNLLPARNRKNAERIGEVRVMNDGSTGTIVEYRNAGDIDIDFGDGRIASHKKYAHFSVGRVKCPRHLFAVSCPNYWTYILLWLYHQKKPNTSSGRERRRNGNAGKSFTGEVTRNLYYCTEIM